MTAKEKYDLWLEKLSADDPLKKELEEIRGDEEEIRERFYSDITFGTAGLRGKTGAGSNRMNRLTVGRASQGIASYILAHGEETAKKGVIITHDPRHFSREFCELAASVFAANGIRTYVFPDMRSTPELAFLIRHLGTACGINITASHNPKEYNGYKAYWSDGCQVSSAVADGMLEAIGQTDLFTGAKLCDYEQAVRDGRICLLGEKEDRAYLDCIESIAVHTGDELDLDIPLVYTPLNGAGAVPFRTMLEERGFTNFRIVPEQEMPDPDFTSVGYPNPEDPKAFAKSEELGRQTGAELLLATDPDADRFAIELRTETGEYIPLNGNQTGYLLVNYILEGRKKAGTLPGNGAMVKSIVTGDLSTVIAGAYGVKMYESLTGFKNICGRIPDIERDGRVYLFGYEESVGYAPCPEIRDKDGIAAGMLVAEAAAYYKKTMGKTLWQVLHEIYETYGFCAENEPNLVLEGIEGAERIGRMMAEVREHPFEEAAACRVEKVIDYRNGYEDIPPSNVLIFRLEGGSWFAIRPSGTEPKIKFYFYTRGDSPESAQQLNRAVTKDVLEKVQKIK